MELYLLQITNADKRVLHGSLYTDEDSAYQGWKEDPLKGDVLDGLVEDDYPLMTRLFKLSEEQIRTISHIYERPVFRYTAETGKWQVGQVVE